MTIETIQSTILLGLGLMVGSLLPDIDLAPVLPIRHRSFWTHGTWLTAVFVACDIERPDWHFLWVGLLAGLGLHLLNDASPKSWRGASLINLFPLPWSLPAWASWLYLSLSGALTLWWLAVVIGGA